MRRDDFRPRPTVDVLFFHMHKETQSDILPGHRLSYERFVTDGMTNAAGPLRRVFTKKQLSIALKQADMKCVPMSGEMRYVQWLCLFRNYLMKH